MTIGTAAFQTPHPACEGQAAPDCEGPAAAWLDWCCPRCKGLLLAVSSGYFCETCDQLYPIVLGIPDFRVRADPYLSIPDDWEKGRRLADQASRTNFRGLVEYYWSITPGTPRHLATRYIRNVLVAEARARRMLDDLRSQVPAGTLWSGSRLLDLGCGTGGSLTALAGAFPFIVGIDIAFRWLVVARKRLAEAGIAAPLVCCCADHLPFREGRFGAVLAGDVIEHTPFQAELVQEAYRTLHRGGVFFATTLNRRSLAANPHVRPAGIGWRLSRFKLERLVRQSSFRRCSITLPNMSEPEQAGLSRTERRLVSLYRRIKDWPVVSSFLYQVGPALQVVGIKD